MPEDLAIIGGLDQFTLSTIFPNPRAVAAFESLQRVALVQTPAQATAAQATADSAAAAAADAQSSVDTVSAAQFLVLALSGALDNERVLTGNTGVTVDTSVAGVAKLVVNALAILNAAPVVLTQPLTAASLATTQTPAATATASDHSIPIVCNGTTFFMRLSTAP